MQKELLLNKEKWKKMHNASDITIGLKETNGKVTDKLVYKFWVGKKKSDVALGAAEKVPKSLNGSTTDVKEEEEYKAYATNEGIKRLRPVKMGASICNVKGTAGTTGYLYKKSGQYFVLSNAHVEAEDPFLYIKDQETANVQPGPYHVGKWPADCIGDETGSRMRYMVLLNNIATPTSASLKKKKKKNNKKLVSARPFIYSEGASLFSQQVDGTSLELSGNYNTCDCALVGPLSISNVVPDIIDIANAPNVSEHIAKPGDKVVFSSWRMNGRTEGVVTDVGKSASVSYAKGKVAMLKDLIVTTKMGEPGTSGSGAMVVLPDGKKVVIGLNFAGSGTTNLICAIQHINNAFGGEVVCSRGSPSPTTHTIQANASNNGTLIPNGAIVIVNGGSQAFKATPDAGYSVSTWRVDGKVVQEGGENYILENVTSDRSLVVFFEKNETPIPPTPPLDLLALASGLVTLGLSMINNGELVKGCIVAGTGMFLMVVAKWTHNTSAKQYAARMNRVRTFKV